MCTGRSAALPLSAYCESGAFKVFMVDVGLFGATSDLPPEAVIAGSRVFTEFKGAHPEVSAVRLSLSGYREQEWMRNVPLYAVSRRSLWA